MKDTYRPIIHLLLYLGLISTSNCYLTTNRFLYNVAKSQFKTGNSATRNHNLYTSNIRRGAIEMQINSLSASGQKGIIGGAPPGLKVIIAGAPAAGKGTQCEMIKTKFGLVHLSTGDILRAAVKQETPLGMKAKEFMDGGQLVPDELIISVICDRLKEQDCESNGWLLDGFPRTRLQADALSTAGMVPDCFLMLDVPEEILVERVTGRRTDPETGKIYHIKFNPPENEEISSRLIQRSDDTAEKIIVRYREFQGHIDSIKSCYEDKMMCIDGSAEQQCVSDIVADTLNKVALENLGLTNKFDDDNDKNVSLSTAKIISPIQSSTGVLKGMVSLILLDKGMAFLFKSKGWAFPSALAAMIGIFSGLCNLRKYAPKLTDEIADGFSPSVSFIKAWLPLFFVPPLVVLPLKMYLLKGVGFQMVGAIISGVFLSLLSAGLIADISGKVFSKPEKLISPEPIKLTPVPPLPSVYVPAAATAGLLLLSKVLPKTIPTILPSIIQTAYGASASMTGYIAGTMLPTNMKKIAHPVLTCAVITIALLSLFGLCNGILPAAALTSYFGTNSFPGAGTIISSMLGPAIISFGIQLYQYRIMLRDNAPRVLSTTLFSAGFGLTSSAILAKVFKLAPAETALSLLARCITTPLALAGSMLTGADPSLTAFVVVVTGVLGASLGESFLELIGIKDPISVGLSMGASAHGLGTAAVSYDPVKFAAAVVSMTLTGLW
eukprot:CAMPEP_0119034660 /NCGR_PEP_ID=MMETSP1177-20130426/1670_1 /TAXON_ID=2985 /ORGANISM="Ochromonas sp, Strain CCMP1899" /LENGTH=720 /DNA_ID=CAMNT_0006992265 /DNA_START=152 /DNA_END=2311 /DNA_ORIENTATION=+